MGRGRPLHSEVRQHMIEILAHMKSAYGYEIYKAYRALFPKVSLRVIYYHLKKGVSLEEFKVTKVEKEQGEYSWGGTAEKIYYGLGSSAKPKGDEKVKEYFEKKDVN